MSARVVALSHTGKPLHRIDPAAVRDALDYDHDTGVFRWRHRANVPASTNTLFAGKIAGCFDGRYLNIVIDGVKYLAHRLAWAHVTGEDAPFILDHFDCDKLNNKFGNLRPATQAENMHNGRTPITNKSGVKGVCWHAPRGKWIAQIRVNTRIAHLGYFTTIESAAAAYAAASAKHHGVFGRVA